MDAQAEKRRALLALYVAGARLGKTRDFASLAQLAGPRLFAHARRLSDDPDTARDIVQEAWAEIAKGLHQLRDDRAFFPWALAIVGRVAARDLRRRIRTRVTLDELAQMPPDTATDPPDVQAAIRKLPAGQRDVLGLFYLEGLTVAEVASALSIPPGTVKTRLLHARTRLRAIFTGENHG